MASVALFGGLNIREMRSLCVCEGGEGILWSSSCLGRSKAFEPRVKIGPFQLWQLAVGLVELSLVLVGSSVRALFRYLVLASLLGCCKGALTLYARVQTFVKAL